MLTLSQSAIIEKNKLVSDGAFLILLEIKLTTGEYIRLVRNTEDIKWRVIGADEHGTAYDLWTAFPFTVDTVSEDSKGELPTVSVKVSNVTGALQYYLENGSGGVGCTVGLYIINSKDAQTDLPAMVYEIYEVTSVNVNANWVSFNLGAGYPQMARRPERRILKNFCPFKYGGIECGLPASVKLTYPTCDKSLANCRERQYNPAQGRFEIRFGGEPTIPIGGLYV